MIDISANKYVKNKTSIFFRFLPTARGSFRDPLWQTARCGRSQESTSQSQAISDPELGVCWSTCLVLGEVLKYLVCSFCIWWSIYSPLAALTTHEKEQALMTQKGPHGRSHWLHGTLGTMVAGPIAFICNFQRTIEPDRTIMQVLCVSSFLDPDLNWDARRASSFCTFFPPAPKRPDFFFLSRMLISDGVLCPGAEVVKHAPAIHSSGQQTLLLL